MHGGILHGWPTGAPQENLKGLEEEHNSLWKIDAGEMASSRAETSEGASGPGWFEREQIFLSKWRNIRACWFVYTGAAGFEAVLARFRKTPRWQPRGRDTQSFRPL